MIEEDSAYHDQYLHGLCGGERLPIDVMLVSYVSEKPDLVLRHKHSHAERMDWRIPKSLIEESPSPVQPLKVFLIGLTPEVV